MWNMNEVTSIEYRNGYVYHVAFDDGMEGDIDLSEYVEKRPVFAPLRDVAYFRKARIECGTIAWPNGADIAAETLYDHLESSASLNRRPASTQQVSG